MLAKPAVDEFYQRIHNFVRRRVHQEQDQEDLVQEIFLKFKENLPKIRKQDRLLSWLYRTAANQVTDYYRFKRPMTSFLEHRYTEPEEEKNSVNQEVAGWLKFFIGNLKAEDREVLQLIELEGKTQKEAAEFLGLTLAATKSRHQRAKQRLKEELEACCRYFLDARGKVIGYQPKVQSECKCS